MALLQVEDLSIQFHTRGRTVHAVEHLSFCVEESEIVGILGESGSGKTTAMLAVIGLLPRQAQGTGGTVLFQGMDITPPPDGRQRKGGYEKRMQTVRGSGISMIFQDPSVYLDDMMTIGRQITETIRSHEKCSQKEADKRAGELLYQMGITDPKQRMRQYPYELSGGICQRAALAIALACRPRLLIADEPSTALDTTMRRQILELLKRIGRETGTAILAASHDLGVISALCRRVLVVKSGQLMETGTTEEIFSNPCNAHTRTLLSRVREGGDGTEGSGSTDVLLSLQNVSRRYEVKEEAVEDVSLEIHRGESYALVGESGCGKTTVARLIAGLLEPGSGEIRYNGDRIIPLGERRRRDVRIQMVFQNPAAALNPALTAGEMLEETLLSAKQGKKGACTEEIKRVLEQTGLSTSDLPKYPYEFSGGQRQRLALARALILNPEFLICDEPVASLDVSAKKQILDLLAKIQKDRNLSILFISHDLGAVRKLCQRIGVMYRGRIVETGSVREVCAAPCHPYTKLLLESEI